MLNKKYQEQIKTIITETPHVDLEFFIYGDGLKHEKITEIEIGVMGKSIESGYLAKLKKQFESLAFPFKIVMVDFNKVESKIKMKVLEGDIIWLT